MEISILTFVFFYKVFVLNVNNIYYIYTYIYNYTCFHVQCL